MVAYLLAELGEQVWRRQQLKPRWQKVPAAQQSECQAHHDAQAKWIHHNHLCDMVVKLCCRDLFECGCGEGSWPHERSQP